MARRAAKARKVNWITTSRPRPPGGHEFEVVQFDFEGWRCLCPWIQTPDGYWVRPHIAANETFERGSGAKAWCEHIAEQINDAMRRRE